ncbi:DoxX family membrane protein [Maritimibacter sp. DP07]|uniref:DoxX family membrane protein n=1 Tax=Maritimibacter harenae TaxID=2606218 RepID=A0A845M2A0_9RHOB|nr:DoxX family protein [Maritimibacter harenae]MZR14155.1 DoxX family membrane protein [Maritimibacter harenae]
MIHAILTRLDAAGPPVLGTLARLTFSLTLAGYFWASALTKLEGAGLSLNAYAQIFPRAMEAAGYDVTQLTLFHTVIVAAGTLAEFILPALLVLGLATRLAALGMIGFIIVQTLTDLIGHGALSQPATLGGWFDRVPDSAILDQRLLWVTMLLVPVFTGPGPLSLDRLIARRAQSQTALAA